jgi:hypothetical protein
MIVPRGCPQLICTQYSPDVSSPQFILIPALLPVDGNPQHKTGLPSAAQGRTFMPPPDQSAICATLTFINQTAVPRLRRGSDSKLRLKITLGGPLIRRASADFGGLRVGRKVKSEVQLRAYCCKNQSICRVGESVASQLGDAEALWRRQAMVGCPGKCGVQMRGNSEGRRVAALLEGPDSDNLDVWKAEPHQ